MRRVNEEFSLRPTRTLAHRLLLATALLLAGCDRGPAPPVAGSWSETFTLLTPGSGITMTLLSDAAEVGGTGVARREAGADSAFTVTGKIATVTSGQIAFHYTDGTTSDFTYAMSDGDHLALSAAGQSLSFVRQ
jgi:hypothetical protein